ncbi:hypothetical protein L1077_14065 [Pseudoalteromonas luteoviolacea]|uniref:hypothetical protein n=1 Tax=Pseudoalteromonas luteoviolacea TaxID=43657 RepID=UPI001F208FCA|nr:hypothetical protein [Pseudoalteromonas luteoviolacea]MCF6440559.1 hypothetical protein [Pseudoalteromonas luteoviolacea]
MKRIKCVIALLSIVLISGCASPSIGLSNQISSENGIVWGSMAYEGNYADYQVHFKNIKTGKKHFISLSTSVNEAGLFAIELPAGSYMFTGWKISEQFILVNKMGETEHNFKSKSGESTYLGQIHFSARDITESKQPDIKASLRNRYALDMEHWQASFADLGLQIQDEHHVAAQSTLCQSCNLTVTYTPAQIR